MNVSTQSLSQFLKRYPELELAILFGSQASGDAEPESDIDLALLASEPFTAERKLKMMEELGAEFGRAVDIVDLYYSAEPVLG